jgi:hypothetical protein
MTCGHILLYFFCIVFLISSFICIFSLLYSSDEVHITTALHLPGYPTDFCFVNHHGEFYILQKNC